MIEHGVLDRQYIEAVTTWSMDEEMYVVYEVKMTHYVQANHNDSVLDPGFCKKGVGNANGGRGWGLILVLI